MNKPTHPVDTIRETEDPFADMVHDPKHLNYAQALVTLHGPIKALEVARHQHGRLDPGINNAICKVATDSIMKGGTVDCIEPAPGIAFR